MIMKYHVIVDKTIVMKLKVKGILDHLCFSNVWANQSLVNRHS